jgi:uncharacterized protein YxjI
MTVDPNEHDRFLLRQRFRPVVNQYEVTLPPEAGAQAGETVCFVEQKRFTFKEDIRFYADDTKAVEVLRLKARQRFDPRARYDVTDGSGAKVGEIQKVLGKSLLRSTYRIYDGAGAEVAIAMEKNPAVAILRRAASLLQLIPFVPPVADWLPIPYHFVFQRGEELLGTHTRAAFKIRDTYRIDLSGDPGRTVDRRLILAIAVGMDALQAR